MAFICNRLWDLFHENTTRKGHKITIAVTLLTAPVPGTVPKFYLALEALSQILNVEESNNHPGYCANAWDFQVYRVTGVE